MLAHGYVISCHLLVPHFTFGIMTNNFLSHFQPGKTRGRKGEEGDEKRDRVKIR